MSTTDLREVAHVVVRQAERMGFVLPKDIRRTLAQTGLSERQWKKVVALSRSSLRLRHGRYYFKPALSARMREEQRQQRAIHSAVRQLVRQYKRSNDEVERRQQGRFDFIQPVKVRAEGEQEITLLSRDLSATGIRLISTRSFLGKRLRISISRSDGKEPACFHIRVLWTCAVADGLYENGGVFLERLKGVSETLKLVRN
jgi:hypothetical protein